VRCCNAAMCATSDIRHYRTCIIAGL
jgi:hypothetical protein